MLIRLVRRPFAAFNTGGLARALIVTIAPGLLYCLTGDSHWLLAILVAISLFIGIEYVGLAPLGVLAQALAIGVGFLLLWFGSSRPPAFVLGCTMLAAAAVAVSLARAQLRLLGNFIFIPTLYLLFQAPEAKESAFELFPYAAVAIAPALALAYVNVLRSQTWRPRALTFMRWLRPLDLGPPATRIEAASAISAAIIAVSLSMILVPWRQWPHGQWILWSAASVVTGSAGAARPKLRASGIGALIGAPRGQLGVALGLIAGFLLPRGSVVDVPLAAASAFALVGFLNNTTSFFTRHGHIQFAYWLMKHSVSTASDRIVEVLVGGAIGVASVHACDRSIRFIMRRFNRCGTVPPPGKVQHGD